MYVIKFSGIFTTGYVKFAFTTKSSDIEFETHEQALNFATKFNFLWPAKILCAIYNNTSRATYDFKTYKVEKI